MKPEDRFSTRIVAAAILIGGLLFFMGFLTGSYNSKRVVALNMLSSGSTLGTSTPDLTSFWKAWTLLDSRFVPTKGKPAPTNEQKVWGAIQGLAASYGDPYTTFFPPEENKVFTEEISGNFEGVGMELGIQDGILTVIAPIKDNPAQKAGVKAGDKIVKINASSTQSITVDQAIKLIRGPKGTPVTITIARQGLKAPLDITIVRDVINIPTVETEIKPGNIFVIHLYTFSAQSADLFRQALRAFVNSGSNKLVLDLRGNPGGYLEAAVDMASWFLPVGKPVVVEDFGGSTGSSTTASQSHRSTGYDIFTDKLKMVILVNGGSASASEILAGALQDYGVATLIGEKTFGKGSVQELLPVTKETSLKVTIARWLTPKGRWISDVGLTPDIIVPYTQADYDKHSDPQMDRAILELNK